MEATLPLSPLVGACQALDMGLKVFPVFAGAKRPALPGWQEWAAESTREKVQTYPDAGCNWGIHCDGLVVVDLDVKHGNDGYASIRKLIEETEGASEDDLLTWRVETPSGGRHLYFRLPEGVKVRNLVRVRQGIDVRSTGGLVVCWGSVVGGKFYRPVGLDGQGGPPILPCPEWLLKILTAHVLEVPVTEGYITEGQRNSALFGMACAMRHTGMNEAEILAGLRAVNASRVVPPLPEWELQRVAANAAKLDVKTAHFARFFTQELGIEPAHAGVTGRQLMGAEPAPRPWLMRGRYLREHLSLVYGPGSAGKSTLLLGDAVAVVTGQPITGAEVVVPGPVWLHQAEDPMDEVQRRLHALCRHHHVEGKDLDPLYITDARSSQLILAVGSRDTAEINEPAVEWCIRRIKSLGVVLWILDPWVAIHRTEESSNAAASAICLALGRVMAETRCAIGIGHHRAKAGAGRDEGGEGARGASALTNAARLVHHLRPLTARDPLGERVDAETRKRLVLLSPVKANMLPPGRPPGLFARNAEQVAGEEVGVLLAHTSDQIQRLLLEAAAEAQEATGKRAPLRARAEIEGRLEPPVRPTDERRLIAAGLLAPKTEELEIPALPTPTPTVPRSVELEIPALPTPTPPVPRPPADLAAANRQVRAEALEAAALEHLRIAPEDWPAKSLVERTSIALALFRAWAQTELPEDGLDIGEVQRAAEVTRWGRALFTPDDVQRRTFAKRLGELVVTYARQLGWKGRALTLRMGRGKRPTRLLWTD